MILTKVKNEIGATAIEYGLIASLVAVVAVSGMSAVGVNLSNTYCTISKHLGGSGECSGGSSKETGGSGSSTGSGNSNTGNGGNGSETSIATEDDMDNLKKSLVDDFDDSYLDRSLGGNSNSDIWSFNNPKNSLSLMNDYNEKNPNDQITHVFGLYDKSTRLRGQRLTVTSVIDSTLPFGGIVGRADWAFGRGMGNHWSAPSA